MNDEEQSTPIDSDNSRQTEGYKIWAGSTLKHLKEAEIDNLNFGPKYTIQTSSGESIHITTVFSNSEGDHNKVPSQLFLFALDKSGKLVGHRDVVIKQGRGNNADYFEGTGFISTQMAGVASCIELAFFDTLQRVADTENVEITYKATNFNAHTDFDEISRDYNMIKKAKEKGLWKMMGYQTESDFLVSFQAKELQYKQKEAEQARWQKLYGPQGELGFVLQDSRSPEGYLIRSFSPLDSDEQPKFSSIETATIQRKYSMTSEGRKLLEGVPISVSTTAENSVEQKTEKFKVELVAELETFAAK
jgi:hypothetical protein